MQNLTARQQEVLNVIRANPGISIHALYVKTSPICQRTGRTRSIGTYNWTIPHSLVKKGAIRIEADRSRIEKAHRDRNKVRYHLYAL